MARAKRTDRAEARRKYRAYLQAQEEAEAASAAGAESPAAAPAGSGARTSSAAARPAYQPGVRLGFVAAARAAARTPTYIDDVRNIRSLVFRSNAVWPVLAICVIAGFYSATRIASKDYAGDPVLPFVFQFLFYPVPLLPPMLAGFLAPRSTWLAGAIASFIATTTLLAVLLVSATTLTEASNSIAGASPSPSAHASVVATGPAASATVISSPAASGTPVASPTPGSTAAPGNSSSSGNITADLATLIQLLILSMSFGALMGALSGWYKRFLALSSGPRNRPPSRPSGSRSQQRRPAARR